MRFRRAPLTILGTAAIAVVTLLAGCGTLGGSIGSVAQPKQGKPIVFGISLSFSGAFQLDGEAFARGYRLWQDDVNSRGGILGRPVKLIILNDNSDPNKAAANYTKLITVDHVDMTLGPFSSLLTGPAAQAAGQHGFAMIEGAGAANTVFQSTENEIHHNVFCPSLPVELYMKPFIAWIKSIPPSQRPKSAAFPTVNDPFATPAVDTAKKALAALGIKIAYSSGVGIKEVPSAYKAPALAVAATNAPIVVLGATDVPTVEAFMKVFEQQHYNPRIFIAVSGPDQGNAFLNPVGKANAQGVMVPGGWYGAYANPLSSAMVEQYIAHYGGVAANINADVAEAFSVGEIAADAIFKTGGTDNAKIIRYLHSNVTFNTVQGQVKFSSLGENQAVGALGFISQWQNGNLVQVLPKAFAGSTSIIYPKPVWGS